MELQHSCRRSGDFFAFHNVFADGSSSNSNARTLAHAHAHAEAEPNADADPKAYPHPNADTVPNAVTIPIVNARCAGSLRPRFSVLGAQGAEGQI